jgi:hypothetical protein
MDTVLRRLSTGDAANEKATFEVDLTDFTVVDVSGGMLAGRSHQLSADLIFLRVINLDLKGLLKYRVNKNHSLALAMTGKVDK